MDTWEGLVVGALSKNLLSDQLAEAGPGDQVCELASTQARGKVLKVYLEENSL